MIAASLAAGATVWTANADGLIEKAYQELGSDLSVVSWPDDPHVEDRLLKLHGSVTTSRYLFTSEQVVRPLAPAWARRLQDDIDGRDLIMFGYAGADLDVRPVLAKVMDRARSISWVCPDWEREQLLDRYPVLAAPGNELVGGPSYDDLLPAFRRLLAERGLTWDDARHATEPTRQRKPELRYPRPPCREWFRARLLLRLGEHDQAWTQLRRALTRTNPRLAPDIARAMLSEGLYSRRSPLAARGLDALTQAHRLGRPARTVTRHAVRVATTLHAFYEYDYEWVRDHLDGDLSEPGALNARAVARRYLGNARDGIRDAQAAFEISRGSGEPDVAANAAFQLCYLTSWAGQDDQFLRWLAELRGQIDALASVRWLGWAHFQQARAAVQELDVAQAVQELNLAEDLLTADNTPGGALSCQILRLTAHRLDGDPDAHQRLTHALENGEQELAPTQAMSVQLEIAERLRRWPESSSMTAADLFGQVSRRRPARPFFQAWALAGLAATADSLRLRAEHRHAASQIAHRAGLDGVARQADLVSDQSSDAQWLLTP
ncbi:MAG TPA: SIR2 family protein [Jatrophihabitans sp.]|jgi:hypothetical protein|uniref:SIR2 family protein n=1 Tax=Jatrophihabitans sp. TaxID=1932789 RepID=UPI002F072087